MLHTLGSLEEVGGIGQPKNLLWMKGDISGVILEEAMFVTGVEELVIWLTSALETCPRMSRAGCWENTTLPTLQKRQKLLMLLTCLFPLLPLDPC